MRTRATTRLTAAFISLVILAASCGDTESAIESASADEGSISDELVLDADSAADHETHSDADHDEMGTDGDHDEMEAGADHHDDMEADGDNEHHQGEELVDFVGEPTPTVQLEVSADAVSGINVHVTTTNYDVNAAAASTEHVEGEGHFHIYIDGQKFSRFYNDWIHLEGVPDGEIEVKVVLSANDHRTYAVAGEPIAATVLFEVPEHAHTDHGHETPDPREFVGAAPTLGIDVVEDPASGYNAFIDLDGMTLSPENASGEHIAGEGHLHLLANGQKLARLYGTAVHIPALPDGDVELTIRAYGNDHRAYTVDGEFVEASITVRVES